jgi:hypothetical protein
MNIRNTSHNKSSSILFFASVFTVILFLTITVLEVISVPFLTGGIIDIGITGLVAILIVRLGHYMSNPKGNAGSSSGRTASPSDSPDRERVIMREILAFLEVGNNKKVTKIGPGIDVRIIEQDYDDPNLSDNTDWREPAGVLFEKNGEVFIIKSSENLKIESIDSVSQVEDFFE